MKWFRCDVEAWDELVEECPTVLTRQQACMDLRRHAHAHLSERQYAERWGWHRSRVRRLMRSDEWLDPYSKRPTQSRPKPDPKPTQPARQPRATTEQTDPEQAQTRPTPDPASIYKDNIISISNKDTSTFDAVVDLWKQYKPKGPRPRRSKGVGKAVAARIDEHGADNVRKVMTWAMTSQHDRAVWLREKHGLMTLMRPANFETYLELSEQTVAARGEWTDHGDDDSKRPLPF